MGESGASGESGGIPLEVMRSCVDLLGRFLTPGDADVEFLEMLLDEIEERMGPDGVRGLIHVLVPLCSGIVIGLVGDSVTAAKVFKHYKDNLEVLMFDSVVEGMSGGGGGDGDE